MWLFITFAFLSLFKGTRRQKPELHQSDTAGKAGVVNGLKRFFPEPPKVGGLPKIFMWHGVDVWFMIVYNWMQRILAIATARSKVHP